MVVFFYILIQLQIFKGKEMIMATQEKTIPILQLGFRPFFVCAGSYAIISIFIWMLTFLNLWTLPLVNNYPNIVYWHAHEMIFGYTMAVVAGFLLTAVHNWTNINTIQGTKLFFLVTLWSLARICFALGYTLCVAILDITFNLGLLIVVVIPLYQSKQWHQISAICTKLLFLLTANILFFLGVFKILANGERFGIYLALYLILALILTIGRQVMPFFTEQGVDYPVTLKNSKILDIANLVLFLIFVIIDLWQFEEKITGIVSLSIAIINIKRLFGWYTYGIWKQPLLWVLHCAYGWIIIGFVLKFFSSWGYVANTAAIHAFTYGGIGMITIGMMARVSLGHTGRSVYEAPKILLFAFVILVLGAFSRVFVPVIMPAFYVKSIIFSQICWLISFGIFALVYFPMFFTARINAK